MVGACLHRKADARLSVEPWITLGKPNLEKQKRLIIKSPEMLNGVSHDKKIDHWALGCIAFEVVLFRDCCFNLFLAFDWLSPFRWRPHEPNRRSDQVTYRLWKNRFCERQGSRRARARSCRRSRET